MAIVATVGMGDFEGQPAADYDTIVEHRGAERNGLDRDAAKLWQQENEEREWKRLTER